MGAQNDGESKDGHGLNNKHLRFLFVAYLFSAAVGEIGKRADCVLKEPSLLWPAVTHLCVAFLATSVSFVHWAATIDGGTQSLRNIFSKQYLLLLLDLFLVILYLSIAQSTDSPGQVSAAPEAKRLAIMYGVYAVWDVCHDVWAELETPSIRQVLWETALRARASFICAAFSLAIWYVAVQPGPTPASQACALNIAEMANVVLFRALKAYEWPAEERLRAKNRLAARKKAKEDSCEAWRPQMRWATRLSMAVLLLIFGAFIGTKFLCASAPCITHQLTAK